MSEPKQVEKVSLHTADPYREFRALAHRQNCPRGWGRIDGKSVQCQSSSHGKIMSLLKKGSLAGGVEALAGGGGRPCASLWESRLMGVNSLLPREVRDESTWQGSLRTHQSGS